MNVDVLNPPPISLFDQKRMKLKPCLSHNLQHLYKCVPLTWWHNKENQMILTMPGPLGDDSNTLEDTEEAKESTSTVRNASLSSWCETFLRILLKQNTALLSTVRPSAACPYTGPTSHVSHIYKGINAMLSSGDPSNPIPSTAQCPVQSSTTQ